MIYHSVVPHAWHNDASETRVQQRGRVRLSVPWHTVTERSKISSINPGGNTLKRETIHLRHLSIRELGEIAESCGMTLLDVLTFEPALCALDKFDER